MPQVTVYVREEDLAKWKSVKKKAEFIHDALATIKAEKRIFKGARQSPTNTVPVIKEEWTTPVEEIIKKVPGVMRASDLRECKNGHPIPDGRDKCLGKGCKYS